MPVYSEVLDDNTIINLVRDYKNILLLGCGACMNESLAFKNDTPIYINENNSSIPYSIQKEIERIKNMLTLHGFKVKYKLLPENSNSRCMINYGKQIYSFLLEPFPDVLLVLSCPAGIFGIKQCIKNIPIIKATKQTGFLAYGYTDDHNGNRIIIKDKSFLSKSKNGYD